MSNGREFFSIQEIASLVIGCAFCENTIRIDYDSSNPRQGAQQVKEQLRVNAVSKNWKAIETQDHRFLNLCEDHAQTFREINLL